MSEVGTGLRRNLSMVVAVVLVTFVSLTFVGAAMLMQLQIAQMKGYWYDRAQVAVYMCTSVDSSKQCNLTEATQPQIAAVKAQLTSPALAPLINRFAFETHAQAYAKYKQQFSGSGSSKFVTPDLLPQTFWVNMKNPAQANAVVETLSGQAGVSQVVDQRKYLDPIFAGLNAASYTAIGIAALMLVAAVLLIATTIRLSAFSRRRELGIMRLVGASNRFIQTPFILEGVIAALIGSAMAGGAIVAIVKFFVQGYLGQALGSTTLVGIQDSFAVVPVLVLTGVVLAAVSAKVAINRYLKV